MSHQSQIGHSPQPHIGAGHEPDGRHHLHVYHNVPPFQRLKALLQMEINDLWVAIVYSLAIGLLTLAVPIATQSLVNTIAFGNLLQPLLVLTLLLLGVLLFSAILQSMRFFVVEMIQRRLMVRISSDVVHRLIRVRDDAFDHYHGPELVNRFLEVVTLQKAGATLLVDGLSVVMQTVIGMILLAVYHPWLLAFDILLLAAIMIVIFPLGSGAVRTAILESKAKYGLVAWLEEVARQTTSFRAAPAMHYAVQRTDALLAEYLNYRGKHFRILLRQVIGSLSLQAIASATLLGVGGWLVINRQLTLGQLIAAELVVALVVSGFSKLGKHLEVFYDLLAAIDKLGYLTDLPLEPGGGEKPRRLEEPAAVRIHGVSFDYPSRPHLLANIHLSVSPGERVALVGHSGRGKSTLLALLFGLREPAGGTVEVDGMDLRELSRSALRSQVAFVRGIEIFHGSLLDNVRMGRQEVGVAEVRDALQAVGLLGEITSMPDGLQTELATGGQPLSSGQAIRLMFARALVGRPRLILIDESLDILDDARERRALMDSLFAANAPWTLIVATSKSGVIERCDRVYTIEDGHLMEVAKPSA